MRRLVSVLVVFVIALSIASCGSKEDPIESSPTPIESMEEVIIATDEGISEFNDEVEVSEEVSAGPSVVVGTIGVAYNMDTHVEFEEPKLYEVISECIAYEDVKVNEFSSTTFPVGACVTIVSTDGVYYMMDNGYLLLCENLSPLE